MVKGFIQIEGINCERDLFPGVRFTFIRILLALVSHLNLELFQMEVKTTFLNGDLEEEIYMTNPLFLY